MGRVNIASICKVLLLGGLMVAFLFGCSAKRYRVEYDGSKELYKGAKDSYRAGKKVTLYFPYVATDTDYHFDLDGERLNVSYDDKKGFILSFTMPDHDVKLRLETVNSMTAPTDFYSASACEEFGVDDLSGIAAETMLLNYCRSDTAAGGERFELVLKTTDDPSLLCLEHYYRESAEAEETLTSYRVPAEVLQDCFWVIREGDMRNWGDGGAALDGVLKVCKFYDHGSYIRVSTEVMPDEAFDTYIDHIERILAPYLTDAYSARQ